MPGSSSAGLLWYAPPLSLEIVLGAQTTNPFDGRRIIAAPPAAVWPFRYPLAVDLPDEPATIVVADLHEAFVNLQTGGTRLVTTQALYLLQSWLDLLGDRDVVIAARADRAALEEHAPEVLRRRGLFARARIEQADPERARRFEVMDASVAVAEPEGALARAMRTADARQRLELCVQALDVGRTAPVLLAAASVCMEVNDLEAAARDLEEAARLAPGWAAVHFERGKLSLRRDDMHEAAAAFREAAECMPAFAPAWSNLGATLGELDRPEEALAAFERARALDPDSPQTLNNIGVVSRELGKLAESEAAFRRVIALAPQLAFGHYNLGHTLFLEGRYQAALAAYVDGQSRDPERNPVQAVRLAMCRLATGDATGALRDLEQATRHLPHAYRHQVLADAHAIAWALWSQYPDLPGWAAVNDWLARELAG